MKIWQSQHIFEHPWENVSRATWQKYPNPNNKNIVAIDVLSRHIAQDGSLVTHRVFKSKWGVPRWINSILPINDYLYSLEKSTVDPQGRSMTLETTNLSLMNVMNVVEKLHYEPHPTDPSKTLLRQEAVISISGLPLIGRLEHFLAHTIEKNAHKGRAALENVVRRISLSAESSDFQAS